MSQFENPRLAYVDKAFAVTRNTGMSNIADLRAELIVELATRRDSLHFWETQPQMPVSPSPGVSDVRASRIGVIKADIRSIEQSLWVVEVALAQGS